MFSNDNAAKRRLNFKLLSKWSPLVFSLLFIIGAVTILVRAASPVSLYLSPSSSSISRGSNFSIAVRINTQGNAVDYVRAYINYPTDKLSVLGISAAGSSFDHQLEGSDSGGQIKITRYSTSGAKNGDLLVATVSFSAANTGTAGLGFDGGSVAYYTNGGSNQPSVATSGGTYTIVNPTPTPPPPVSNPPAPAPGPRPTPPANPAPSPSPVTPPASLGPTPSPEPTPNNENQTILHPVSFTIKDHKDKPAAGVEIRTAVNDNSLITDEQGTAATLLPTGEQTVFVKSANVTKQFSINVIPKEGGNALEQEFVLTMPNPGLNTVRVLKLSFGPLLACVVALVAYLIYHKKGRRMRLKPVDVPVEASLPTEIASTPLPIADDQPRETPVAATLPTPVAEPAPKPQTHQPKYESKTVSVALHPHDTAKTIHPVSKDLQVPPEELPAPKQNAPTKTIPEAPLAAQPAKPESPKTPPKAVDPYKPDGEPKDIFEMAEERFNNDERLKNLRK